MEDRKNKGLQQKKNPCHMGDKKHNYIFCLAQEF